MSERVRAYRSVHEAYTNAEASLKFINDEEWADRLGEKEEIEQAYEMNELRDSKQDSREHSHKS